MTSGCTAFEKTNGRSSAIARRMSRTHQALGRATRWCSTRKLGTSICLGVWMIRASGCHRIRGARQALRIWLQLRDIRDCSLLVRGFHRLLRCHPTSYPPLPLGRRLSFLAKQERVHQQDPHRSSIDIRRRESMPGSGCSCHLILL